MGDASLDAAIAKLEKVAKDDRDPEVRARAKRLLQIARGEVPDADARAGSPKSYADLLSMPAVKRHVAQAQEQWTPRERELLQKLDRHPANGGAKPGEGVHMEGTRQVLSYVSPEAAARRVKEMLREGLVPPHREPANVASMTLKIEGGGK